MCSLKYLPLAGALAIAATQGAQAADLFNAPYEAAPLVAEQAVELGTGWYLRGDAGWTRAAVPQVTTEVTQASMRNGAEGTLGFGYKFNNWFRSDITASWGAPSKGGQVSSADTWCPYGAAPFQMVGKPYQYIVYDPTETCTPKQRLGFSQRNVMLNGYLDLGTWSGVTPYIGAGVGVANVRTQYNLDFSKTSDGSLYNNVDVTAAFPVESDSTCNGWWNTKTTQCMPNVNVPLTRQSWSRAASLSKYNFAWSLMAGLAIDISDHAKLDIGYRYMNLGQFSTLATAYDWSNGAPTQKTLTQTTKSLTSQEVKVGIRYMID